jgi:hypothetical protein
MFNQNLEQCLKVITNIGYLSQSPMIAALHDLKGAHMNLLHAYINELFFYFMDIIISPQISDPYNKMGAILASNSWKNTVFDI